jgi:hypothetical protein
VIVSTTAVAAVPAVAAAVVELVNIEHNYL